MEDDIITTVNIAPDALDDVTMKLRRLTVKAERHNVPFAYEVGEQSTVRVRVEGEPVIMPAVPVTVTTGIIGADGWRLVARITHGGEANIVDMITDDDNAGSTTTPDPAWYTVAAHCDHCDTTRRRNYTFIVEHPTMGRKQVGSNCLEEYTGIDPVAALLYAEVRDIPALTDDEDIDAGHYNAAIHANVYPLKSTLAYAVALNRVHGFIPASKQGSNKATLLDLLNRSITVTDDDRAEAERIIAWFINGDASADPRSTLSKEFTANCVSITLNGYVDARHMGYVAFMPVAYGNAVKRAEAKPERASKHIGATGEKVSASNATIKLTATTRGYYGYTYIYEFTTMDGNILVWFASKPVSSIIPVDGTATVDVRGTVKKHDQYRGVNRTVLTRCRITQ